MPRSPLQARNLERFSDRRINMVIHRALTVCSLLFTSVAAGAYALFGSNTKENVLLNLTPDALATYIPPIAASLLCFLIRLGYCVCLMTTFTMLNWSLRETICDALFGVHMPALPKFLAVSYGTLTAVYIVSVMFPSVWTAMTLTGATAAVFVAYILPGALILKVERKGVRNRVLGAVCVGMGCLISVIGVLNTLVFSRG
jgi:solute carrier family 38 (sodium-coupled neutral amino acid transporter), member 11